MQSDTGKSTNCIPSFLSVFNDLARSTILQPFSVTLRGLLMTLCLNESFSEPENTLCTQSIFDI